MLRNPRVGKRELQMIWSADLEGHCSFARKKWFLWYSYPFFDSKTIKDIF